MKKARIRGIGESGTVNAVYIGSRAPAQLSFSVCEGFALSALLKRFWEFPNLVACKFYVEALFCALLCPFVDLRSRSFVLIWALLRSFACFCVQPRLERPGLGNSEGFRFAKGFAVNSDCNEFNSDASNLESPGTKH